VYTFALVRWLDPANLIQIMRILLALQAKLPVFGYGGAERIIWWLGKTLAQKGHEVTILCAKNSTCDFAKVLYWQPELTLAQQIGHHYDVVHIHGQYDTDDIAIPHLTTLHANLTSGTWVHPNTVFLSNNHAWRHGGDVFVNNGLLFEDYGDPILDLPRKYFHFLGKAAWREKNLRGALELTNTLGERLHVLGGSRLGMRSQPMVMLSTHARFHGMVGGGGKNILINGSKGLVFPVLWHEPFGLTVIESLYFGCPVFGTPYGALPELITQKKSPNRPQKGAIGGSIDAVFSEFGVLSVKRAEILDGMRHAQDFDRRACHDFVRAYYSADTMTRRYLALYEQVASGKPLHTVAWQVPDGPQTTHRLLSLS
jgi:glycosyltransferase involved in cell wall biosynthesis